MWSPPRPCPRTLTASNGVTSRTPQPRRPACWRRRRVRVPAQVSPAASASLIASPNALSTATDARQHSRTLASGSGAFATRSRRCSPEPLSRTLAVLVHIISILHPRSPNHLHPPSAVAHHPQSCLRADSASLAAVHGDARTLRSGRRHRVRLCRGVRCSPDLRLLALGWAVPRSQS